MEEINTEIFGKNLNYLRKKQGLTIQEIASMVGFTRTQWTNYENHLSFPKFIDLIKIAKYFDIQETTLIHVDIEIDGVKRIDSDIYIIEVQKELIKLKDKELQDLRKKLKSEDSFNIAAEDRPEAELKKK